MANTEKRCSSKLGDVRCELPQDHEEDHRAPTDDPGGHIAWPRKRKPKGKD